MLLINFVIAMLLSLLHVLFYNNGAYVLLRVTQISKDFSPSHPELPSAELVYFSFAYELLRVFSCVSVLYA